ncbi:hypothetical protein ACHAXS_012181 [Conticribra weissflogii]
MVDPASSSSSDDGSSSPSIAIESRPIRRIRASHETTRGKRDDGSDEGSESDEESGEYGPPQVANFDDLPTDDSEEEDSSDDDDSNNDAGGESDDETNDKHDVANEDLPLGERVASRAKLGRRYYTGDSNKQRDNSPYDEDGGKQRRAERKSRAIELATERLKMAKAGKKASTCNDGESSDDDSSNENVSNNRDTGGKNSGSKVKKSKHAPTEMSSKRRDHFARVRKSDLNSSGIGVSIGANKYKPRDPRMVSLSGHLDADTFEKRYDFLDDVSFSLFIFLDKIRNG